MTGLADPVTFAEHQALRNRVDTVEEILWGLLAALAKEDADLDLLRHIATEVLVVLHRDRLELDAGDAAKEGASSESARRTRTLRSRAGGDAGLPRAESSPEPGF